MYRLIVVALLNLAFAHVSWGTQSPITFYFSKGFPEQATKQLCAQDCNDTKCQQDITNKSYTCLLSNCIGHTPPVVKFHSCSNRQFSEYVKDKQQEIQQLVTQNQASQKKINVLESTLDRTADQIVVLNNKVEAAKAKKLQIKAQHANQVQGLQRTNLQLGLRVINLQKRLTALVEANRQLNNQLGTANQQILEKSQDIEKLKSLITENQKEIDKLNQELKDANTQLEELLEIASQFVERVQDVEKMFQTKTTALKEINGTLLERIREADKIIKQYQSELMPYAAQKEAELDALVKDMQATVQLSQEFIETAKHFMNESKQKLKDLKTVW